ncbi:MAG: acetoacetate decarboxylase [Acidimicrobiia bacterium]|nr:acetoacetate decarboxylase [Acidimicrobiia bacterium]
MSLPDRQRRLAGRYALVDDIAFTMPVNSEDSPALMAAFTINAKAAQALLPGNELQVIRLPNGRGLLMVTVIDYRTTDIGAYVEYSIAIAVTHGEQPQSALPALLFQKRSGVGQYVWDLPVSSKISVKGGRGIWGMPKHQANLDFRVDDHSMSSQYDLDGELCMRITVNRPRLKVPLKNLGAVNYCAFRGMLMKSYIYFSDRAEVAVGPFAKGQILLGAHPRMDPLRRLDIADHPLFVATMPHSHGVLDDHYEGWFLTSEEAPNPDVPPEGLEQVFGLPKDEGWLPPPRAAGR